MIVRHFLQWIRTAPAGDRAEATGALARAFIYSDLSDSDRDAAEGALVMMLDDSSPLVRQAMADVFAGCDIAPPTIIHALAYDQSDIATPVLQRSPLLLDADLVELVATGESERQTAIAARDNLPCSVSAAIAEVGCAESCLVLLENWRADIVPFSIDRIVERFGHLGVIRDALLERDNLPAATRHSLVVKLSQTLADFVTAREWLPEERARRIAYEACERATVALAADVPEGEVRPLVRHLHESGQLTAGLILRSLLSGHIELFEDALAELADVPLRRVVGIVHDGRGSGFRALYDKAGLPASAFPAFREAVEAMHDDGFVVEPGGASRLKRRIVERVLTRCENEVPEEIAPLLTLLRRYAAEAAREEARLFCDDLVANDWDGIEADWEPAAA
ncbi:MAG: DUF2336 domain-containing protein [Rhizobiales bacterium]|nr:DUF2336 domain-containing protein [Hyphomicrobiales bacterium]